MSTTPSDGKSFPNLLKTAGGDCRRAWRPILAGSLIVGVVSIIAMNLWWRAAREAGLQELRSVIGPEAVIRLEEQIQTTAPAASSAQMQRILTAVQADLQTKLSAMPEEKRKEVIGTAVMNIITQSLPAFAGFILLSAILSLWGRALFFVLAVRPGRGFSAIAGEALTWMLPLLGISVLTFLLLFIWIPVAMLLLAFLNTGAAVLGFFGGLAVPIALGPRFLLGPAILIQERAGVIESMRRSYRITQGRWLKVFGNYVGAAAMVWFALYVFQFVLGMLIGIALPVSPAAAYLGQAVVIAHMLGVAYRTVFLVRLKESVISSSS